MRKTIYLCVASLLLLSCKKEPVRTIKIPDYAITVTSYNQLSPNLQLLAQQVDQLMVSDKYEALRYAAKITSFSQQLSYERGQALGHYQQAYIHATYFQKYDSALWHYKEALDLYKDVAIPQAISDCYFAITNTYMQLEMPIQALDYCYEWLDYAQNKEDQITEAKTYRSIASVYVFLRNEDKALMYLDKALAIYKTMHRDTAVATLYMTMGDVYMKATNDLEAKDYYNDAISLFKLYNKNKQWAEAYFKLGLVHKNLNEFPLALSFFNQSMAIAKEDDLNIKAKNLFEIGSVYYLTKEYKKASTALYSSRELGLKVNDEDILSKANNLLYSVLLSNKNKADTFEAIHRHSDYYDLYHKQEDDERRRRMRLYDQSQAVYEWDISIERINRFGKYGLFYQIIPDILTGIALIVSVIISLVTQHTKLDKKLRDEYHSLLGDDYLSMEGYTSNQLLLEYLKRSIETFEEYLDEIDEMTPQELLGKDEGDKTTAQAEEIRKEVEAIHTHLTYMVESSAVGPKNIKKLATLLQQSQWLQMLKQGKH